MFLQSKRETRPDSFGTPATLFVFRSNRFIIKGYSLYGSMLSVKGPDDAGITKNPDGFFSSSWFEGFSKPENKKGGNPTFDVLKNQSEKKTRR